MTEDEAFEAIRDFMAGVNRERRYLDPTYVPLVAFNRAFDKGPVLKGPFGLITFLGEVDNNEADHSCYGEAVILERSMQATDDDFQQVAVATEARVRSVLLKYRFDFYASRAGNYAKIFHSAFRSSRALTDLAHILPRNIQDVTYQPELKGDVWEGRANFSVEFATLHSDPVAIDTINSGRITIEGQGAASTNNDLTFAKGT